MEEGYGLGFYAGILVAMTICGFIGRYIATQKGRDPLEGFLFGFFLAAIGWIIEGLLPEVKTPKPAAKGKSDIFRNSLLR